MNPFLQEVILWSMAVAFLAICYGAARLGEEAIEWWHRSRDKKERAVRIVRWLIVHSHWIALLLFIRFWVLDYLAH